MNGGERLEALRQRWEDDPGSRIFLQLAEEYRRQGEMEKALGVLEDGLKRHPNYLSAQVALGRCQLELGDAAAARQVLERVVKRDTTQMVANKLLVRAYLELGKAELAHQRLDYYSLLNDSDPEIAQLRESIRQLKTDLLAEVDELEPREEDEAGTEGEEGAEAGGEEVFESEAGEEAEEVEEVFEIEAEEDAERAEEVFEIEAAEEEPELAPPPEEGGQAGEWVEEPLDSRPEPRRARPEDPLQAAMAAVEPARPARSEAVRVSEPGLKREMEDEGEEPFAELGGSDAERAYLEALGAEGLFPFEPPPPPAPPARPEPAAPAPRPQPMPEVPAAGDPFAEPPPEPTAPSSPETAAGGEVGDVFDLGSPADEGAAAPPDPLADLLESEAAPADGVGADPAEAMTEGPAEPTETIRTAAEAGPTEPKMAPADAVPEPPAVPAAPAPPRDKGREPPRDREQATTTLGDLYLSQGHYREAAAIFSKVLRRDPASEAARLGLERAIRGGRRREVTARDLLDEDALAGGLTERKAALLRSYLRRVRGGEERHVS